MDALEVSGVDQYAQIMTRAKAAHREAQKHRGETVSQFPPRDAIISRFMTALSQARSHLGSSMAGRTIIATSQIPAPYSPCTKAILDLEPIAIAEMKLETHHRGEKVLLRVCTPPHRMTAVMVVVEDQRGTAAILQLYNQPEESIVPAEQILQTGDILVLKEPFFKRATDGSYSLRADHVSDIVWLQSTDESIPEKWKAPTALLSDSTEARLKGNEFFKKQSCAAALRS